MDTKDTTATEELAEADEEDTAIDGPDIFYVCKRVLEDLRLKLKANETVSQEAVNELTFPEGLKDEEMMVPVDMRGVGQDFDDVEQMLEKLGPKGALEGFIKAKDYFDANDKKDDDCAKPMTAAEWREVLEQDNVDEEGEEEYLAEGEEEEEGAWDEPEDEEGDEGDEGEDAGEPAAK